MIDERDAFAKVLAAPFERDTAERARLKFIEFQTLVDTLDRAIAAEKAPGFSRFESTHCGADLYPDHLQIEG
jgi:hypothetical protein